MGIKNFVLIKKNKKVIAAALVLFLVAACSEKRVPGTFQLLPKEKGMEIGFDVVQEVVSNSKAPVDILWVIDNSISMQPSQDKLKKGLTSFAESYLHPQYDIQMGVITTDAFVAHEKYKDYLGTEIYIKGVNQRKTPKELYSDFGPDYAKLTSGKRNTSGRPIIATLPPELEENSTPRLNYSSQALLADFSKNISLGTEGLYEERAFESVLQFLADNEIPEDSVNKLFRKDSTRIIVFLGDEDDQSLDPSYEYPEPLKLLYRGSYYVGKDEKTAEEILPAHFTIQCPEIIFQGVTLAPMSICVREGLLMPVDTFKNKLDKFFEQLDKKQNSSNYMVVAIVLKELSTIELLRSKITKEITHEPGFRFLELVDKVGNGSFSMDIGVDDYSPILDEMGLIIENRSTVTTSKTLSEFTITPAPTAKEDMRVWIKKENGTEVDLKPEQFDIQGTTLTITDKSLLDTILPTDKIHVWYVPATVL